MNEALVKIDAILNVRCNAHVVPRDLVSTPASPTSAVGRAGVVHDVRCRSRATTCTFLHACLTLLHISSRIERDSVLGCFASSTDVEGSAAAWCSTTVFRELAEASSLGRAAPHS